MDAEPDNPARILIHDDQDLVGPQPYRLAPEQIHTPETVFHVAQESQPGGTIGVLSRPVVLGENPPNHVFVDWDVQRQGDLLVTSSLKTSAPGPQVDNSPKARAPLGAYPR